MTEEPWPTDDPREKHISDQRPEEAPGRDPDPGAERAKRRRTGERALPRRRREHTGRPLPQDERAD